MSLSSGPHGSDSEGSSSSSPWLVQEELEGLLCHECWEADCLPTCSNFVNLSAEVDRSSSVQAEEIDSVVAEEIVGERSVSPFVGSLSVGCVRSIVLRACGRLPVSDVNWVLHLEVVGTGRSVRMTMNVESNLRLSTFLLSHGCVLWKWDLEMNTSAEFFSRLHFMVVKQGWTECFSVVSSASTFHILSLFSLSTAI